MFILLTAISAIFAVLALALRQPLHWLGLLGVIVVCLAVIGVLELLCKVFPPKPRFIYYLPEPARPAHPLQTLDFTDGDSPFAPPVPGGESPFASRPTEPPSELPPRSPPPASR
ncbi:MAG TPA: hypothetical protein VFV87_14590, partial [Pirellulaceae bacterium]|nr:hypothetical protein [Pirellulaceae bacterium]